MAGGSDGSYLDSVELNVAGENGWTYGFPLPKQLWAPRGVTVMSRFYIIGELHHTIVMLIIMSQGGLGEDAVQVYQEDGWKTVGHMNVPRCFHAVSVGNYFCPNKTIL